MGIMCAEVDSILWGLRAEGFRFMAIQCVEIRFYSDYTRRCSTLFHFVGIMCVRFPFNRDLLHGDYI